MDVLSSLVQNLNLRSGRVYHASLTAPWGIDFPARSLSAPFYSVIRGAAVAEIEGTSVYVSAGDLLVLPRGMAHFLRDSQTSPTVPFKSLSFEKSGNCSTMVLRQGQGGPETQVMAGDFLFDNAQMSAGFTILESYIHIHAGNPAIQYSIDPILKMLEKESSLDEPGAKAAEGELLKLLFLNVLRFAMNRPLENRGSCPRSPLALMFNSELRSLTEALHDNPGRSWTIAAMAAKAGMSRTKFAERFSEVAGESPVSYLTKLRLGKAFELLEKSDATLEEIAGLIGYGSEAAFSTAFKRETGLAPGAYRRNQRDLAADVLTL